MNKYVYKVFPIFSYLILMSFSIKTSSPPLTPTIITPPPIGRLRLRLAISNLANIIRRHLVVVNFSLLIIDVGSLYLMS